MEIRFQLRTKGRGLSAMGKQAAYAMALTINRTLDEAQVQIRAGIRQRFTIRGRSAGFIDRLVKRRREDVATKERMTGRLRIEGPEGDLARAKILTRHEEGGPRTVGIGYSIDPVTRMGGFFHIPTEILRHPFSASVERKMYPAHLGLTARRTIEGATVVPGHRRTRAGKDQIKGKQRTFVLFSPSGRPWGIYQRGDGTPGKTRNYDIHLIWRFDRQITLKPRLQFFETGRETIQQRVPVNYPAFLRHALRTAR